MKSYIAAISLVFLLIGCKKGDTSKQRYVSESSGKLNHISIVVDNLLWEDTVGEAIRNVLAAPMVGLPQDEPLYSLSQMPPQVFSGFAAQNRTVLKIEKGQLPATTILTDKFARPQTLVLVTGQTNSEIVDQINSNSQKIIEAFKKTEIKEQQRRIALSLFNDQPLKDNLGVSMNFPSAYRIAKSDDQFFWIRKDIKTGTMDMLLYQAPLEAIRKGDSAVADVVRLRDSIGKMHIEGRLEGSYLGTESAYAPYIFETTIDNKPTLETKGIWDLKNDFMSGPFINYAIEDKENNRYVIVEGYVFAPSVDKRDYVFELESIIRSVRIK